MVSDVSLLRRYNVELPGPLLIEERAFGLVAAAPVFVATRNEKEFARPNALFARFILIQVGAFDNDQGDVVGVGVHARIIPGIELTERCVGALVWIAHEYLLGNAAHRRRFICGLA